MKTASATITLDNGQRLTIDSEYEYEPEDPQDRENPGCPASVTAHNPTIRGVPALLTRRQYERLEAAILNDLGDD